ncbi:tRNA 2-selenouridine(34) synthase MnmH [Paracandidimonas soli]|uniref:tRNA 2-selenouridine synthase n=1 Tax=Paracandidimonas soli TaxID=1917182 RepID=A0A4R3UR70_9BURK|nr:tRNA 2-selenouridine(34) synthase MnmH [Paracandidimonas soli]TCU93157.1 tRNA 2-selenouridine synthase [Paracandidimonas soli]
MMTPHTPDTSDYRALFLSGVELLDVRAPVEFEKGAFPGAVNLPLMDDEERSKVGICYKQQGQEAAIALGHRLVSGGVKEARVAAWAEFARSCPDGFMYCFRGGLRSKIAQAWLSEAGIAYPRVAGGYKAMRGFLMEVIAQAAAECRFIVLGGMTGTGKTDVILPLPNGLDLEGHAHHRGSSFGRHATEQPPQIDFENSLAIDVLKKRHAGASSFVVEDEGQFIGRCNLPLELYQAMKESPIVWLEDSQGSRVQRILRDYVIDLGQEFVALHGREQGMRLFAERLRTSLDNIRRRLGDQRHRQLRQVMDAALEEQMRSGDIEPHREWILGLLEQYYDPMYVYQRQQKASRIIFSGDRDAVSAYLVQRRYLP